MLRLLDRSVGFRLRLVSLGLDFANSCAFISSAGAHPLNATACFLSMYPAILGITHGKPSRFLGGPKAFAGADGR